MIDIQVTKELHGSHSDMNLDIDLQIQEGSLIALTGQSGSGKTTLLRILAGLEKTDGSIKVGEDVWQGESFTKATQKRHIGFVFQDYALFENMSVLQNLLFVTKDKDLAFKLLEMTDLTQLQDRMPNTLSGGQKQRVSLCRAMMNRPKLLLLDEPLSALDVEMRNRLQREILALHKEFKTTTILVSHDPSEIYKLADRVIVLSQGKIIKDGSVKEILRQTQGSQKFSFRGEILDIVKADIVYIAVVSIAQQIVEVVLDEEEIKEFTVGDEVQVGTKAFAPSISLV